MVQQINLTTKIILASASPRRKALLESMGIKFTVHKSSLDEDRHMSFHHYKKPVDLAIALASGKAENVSHKKRHDVVIIAADTIVVMDDKIMGKPKDKTHAARILRLLSGKTHKVITGVCLLKMPAGISYSFPVTTNVTMRDMTDSDIRWYIGTGEPMDKAGAYGIQGLGGLFVKKINGSYTNVVGLPLTELFAGLKKLGVVIY